MGFFSKFSKALKFVDVIGFAIEAMADGKLTPDEIAKGIDKGLDTAGIKGIDSNDIQVSDSDQLGSGGFAIHFSPKVKEKLTVEFD